MATKFLILGSTNEKDKGSLITLSDAQFDALNYLKDLKDALSPENYEICVDYHRRITAAGYEIRFLTGCLGLMVGADGKPTEQIIAVRPISFEAPQSRLIVTS